MQSGSRTLGLLHIAAWPNLSRSGAFWPKTPHRSAAPIYMRMIITYGIAK